MNETADSNGLSDALERYAEMVILDAENAHPEVIREGIELLLGHVSKLAQVLSSRCNDLASEQRARKPAKRTTKAKPRKAAPKPPRPTAVAQRGPTAPKAPDAAPKPLSAIQQGIVQSRSGGTIPMLKFLPIRAELGGPKFGLITKTSPKEMGI